MSPELKQALKDILKVVDEKRRPTWFCREDGLCYNVQAHGRYHVSMACAVRVRREIEQLLISEGLKGLFPFNNNNHDDYWAEVDGKKNLRWKNPKRMAWLKEHAQ